MVGGGVRLPEQEPRAGDVVGAGLGHHAPEEVHPHCWAVAAGFGQPLGDNYVRGPRNRNGLCGVGENFR